MPKNKDLTTEVLAVGNWNGMEFTPADLQGIAAAFHALHENHDVPLKMGHNKKQPFTDGQPALGWVTDLFVKADKLLAKLSDMPEIVYEAMKKKLYKHVSVELDLGVDYKGQHFPAVLSGVALLGADIPAVNTLKDLQAFMGRDLHPEKTVAFTAININKSSSNHRSETMTPEEKEKMDGLQTTVNVQNISLTKLTEENVLLKGKVDKQKAEFSVLSAAEEVRKLGATRSKLETKLEGMVKDSQITPASRDKFMRDFDDAESKDTIVFAVDSLADTIQANPAYFGAEQARKAKEKKDGEDGKKPGDIVLQRTNEYMVKHGEKDFSVAKTAVLQADNELAELYTKGGA